MFIIIIIVLNGKLSTWHQIGLVLANLGHFFRQQSGWLEKSIMKMKFRKGNNTVKFVRSFKINQYTLMKS